jgi:hypothetical protein
MRSLGRLVRGLSALFWGLPITLVVGVQVARTDWLRPLGVFPPVLATALLLYGLLQLEHFRRQERVWAQALERAKLLGLINLGLSPFLFWWYQLPEVPLYTAAVSLLALSGLFFLYHLNQVLQRLAAMLPDETLRHETKLFTSVNFYLLLVTMLFLASALVIMHLLPFSRLLQPMRAFLDRDTMWFLVLLVLLPVAMTMALLWKIKAVILASVFGADS